MSQDGSTGMGLGALGGNASISAGPSGSGSGILADPTAVIDPWQNAAPAAGSSRRPNPARRANTLPAHTLSHRLSYDHASGVIMLPDDGEWLVDGGASDDDDDDDSEEDYGAEGGNLNGLEQSITESMISESGGDAAAAAAASAGGDGVALGLGGVGAGQGQSIGQGIGQRLSRYGTYFHHPERRRTGANTLPGAFPTR